MAETDWRDHGMSDAEVLGVIALLRTRGQFTAHGGAARTGCRCGAVIHCHHDVPGEPALPGYTHRFYRGVFKCHLGTREQTERCLVLDQHSEDNREKRTHAKDGMRYERPLLDGYGDDYGIDSEAPRTFRQPSRSRPAASYGEVPF